jgi:hypothetical protein
MAAKLKRKGRKDKIRRDRRLCDVPEMKKARKLLPTGFDTIVTDH